MVSQVDFAATFAQIIGHKVRNEEAVDSYSILPILKGEKFQSPFRVATVQNTAKGKYALRQGNWVLIDAATGAAKKEPEFYLQNFDLPTYPKDTPGLLYNLKEDPGQSQNRYQDEPERVASMRALLHRYIAGERCSPLRTQ